MSNYRLSQRFPQKRAFITGAASGLGEAFALNLAKDGWTIGAADINGERLKQLQQKVAQFPGKVLPFSLDVSDAEQYKSVSEQFLTETGGIDLLINNAGVADGNYLGDFSLADWNWITGINQLGVVYGCHHFLPALKKQQQGHIINIASAAAFACGFRMAGYNTTKAAVLALSETLYAELAPHKIGVSVAMPLFFRSQLMESVKGDDAKLVTTQMVDGADIDADAIAHRILKAAGKKRLYVHTSNRSYILHWFKRTFPMLFQRIKAWLAHRPERVTERAARKYEKRLKARG